MERDRLVQNPFGSGPFLLGLNDLFQSDEFLSVEFAPSCLKIARAQPDGSSLSVEYVDRESVNLDGSDRVEKYTKALTALRERRSFSGIDQVAFSLPTSGVIVRPMKLPAVSDERLDRAVRYEVEDKDSEIPFSPEEVVMDYEVIERTEKETRVVLAVVKREKLEEYLQVIRNVGLEAKIIDVTSFSLFNFYKFFQNQPDSSSPKALVDVGENHTDIVIFRGSSLHYARSTSVAGRRFTESIRNQLDVDFDRAEELKLQYGNLPLTEKPAPPPPPESSVEESNVPGDDPSETVAPPPPSRDRSETTDSGEKADESLELGTEFETDKSAEEPFDPTHSTPASSGEAGLNLEGGLEMEPDSGEKNETSDSLTHGGSRGSTEEDDEEPTLDSSLGLSSSESRSDSTSSSGGSEPMSDDRSDEEAPPPPPPSDSPEDENAGEKAGSAGEDNELPLGTKYNDGDSSSGETSEEAFRSESDDSPAPPPAPDTEDLSSAETVSSEPVVEPNEDQPVDDDRDEPDLDLDLGERRSPEKENDSEDELTDPFSGPENEEDDEGTSLGAASNQSPPPPPESEYDPIKLQEALEEPVRQLIDELRQTFDYFRDEMNGGVIEEIILCGNGARIRNFPAYLEEELERDTRYFEPRGVKGLFDEESVQTMMSVLGLQLRSKPSRSSVQFNLLPRQLVREREQRERQQKMIVNGALAGLLVLQVLVWLFYSYQVRLSHFEQSKKQLNQVQPIVDRVSQLERTQSTLQRRLDVINDLETRQARLLPVLYELNQLNDPLRKRTWIRNLSFSAGEPHGVLELEGVTGSFQDVSQLYEWLEEREFTVDQASGSQNRSTLTVDGEERGVVQFSVSYEVRFDSYNTSGRES